MTDNNYAPFAGLIALLVELAVDEYVEELAQEQGVGDADSKPWLGEDKP